MTLRRIGVSLIAAGSLAGLSLAASPAIATHDRPAHADTLHVELVPLFRETISTTQCQARGGTPSTHGAPLSFSSCNPPGFLPGVQAHQGPQAVSNVDLTVQEGDGDPSNGDTADVTIVANMTDIRALSASGADYNPVPAAGAQDMTGASKIRISDHHNTTGAQACSATTSCPATMIDFDFTVAVTCAPTADTTVGSTCTANTTADGTVPDVVKEGKQAVVQLNRIRVWDAGSDGIRGNQNDRDAFMQGIYIP